MKSTNKSSRFQLPPLNLAFFIVFVLFFIAVYLLVKSNSKPVATYPINQPITQTQPRPTQTKSFNAQQFYAQVQNGMSLSELEKLTNKTGECGNTGAYQPSDTMNCVWEDPSFIVTARFSKGIVVEKSHFHK